MFPGFNKRKRSSIANGDWDRDGVRNRKDCEPLNFRKQGPGHKKVNWVKTQKKFLEGYLPDNDLSKCPICGYETTDHAHLEEHHDMSHTKKNPESMPAGWWDELNKDWRK